MRISKQARRIAKELFTLCRVDGRLDEDRVRAVVGRLVSTRPRGYAGILHHFKHLVELDFARRAARVESAFPLPAELRQGVQTSLTRRYGAGLHFTFLEKPELLGGLRVQVGSDVYDGTVAGRLAALAARFQT